MTTPNDWSAALQREFCPPPSHPDARWPSAVSEAIAVTAQHVRSSPAVREYLAGLPKGKGTSCPDSPLEELVRHVADQTGQIDKTDPVIVARFTHEIMLPVFQMERGHIQTGVVAESRDITDTERDLFGFSLAFGDAVDRLYHRWFRAVVVPFQSLSAAEGEIYRATAKGILNRFDYTVFDYDPVAGFTNRRPWSVAFPEEIAEIVYLLASMAGFEDLEISECLAALRTAYACDQIEVLEERWAAVDAAWIKIKNTCRTFPVHGMEHGYEHPLCVSPEFRLVVRTDYGQELIRETQAATPVYARQIGISNELVALAEQKMSCIDVSVFATAVRAGVCTNFRAAGQVVPNRQDILAQGGKTFMDKETSAAALVRYRDLLTRFCIPTERAEALAERITLNGMLLHTACHEFTRPIGCTPESDARLGDLKSLLVEEGKASIGGLAAVLRVTPSQHDANLADPKSEEVVALSIARVCRFFTWATFTNPTVQPYVRENLAMAKMLIDTGVVIVTPHGIDIAFKYENLVRWRDAMREFYLSVVNAYHSVDPVADVCALEARCCARDMDAINNWIAFVNS